MSKHPNHEADMENANKGMPGQNETHAKNQGNRGKQLNVNYPNDANRSNKPKENSENNKSEK